MLASLIAGLTKRATAAHNVLADGFANKAAARALNQAQNTAARSDLVEILLKNNKLARKVFKENGIGRQVSAHTERTSSVALGTDCAALLKKLPVAKGAFNQSPGIMTGRSELL
jgi:hypothetical protein